MRLRPGGPADAAALLKLWDEAIAWLVARNQPDQWGTEPASRRPRHRERVERWTRGSGLTVAESQGGELLGASVVVDNHPAYVPPPDSEDPELYLLFLVSSRRYIGRGVGEALVRHAADQARRSGRRRLRVDCWAGAPTLVAWYERQGFTRSATYRVGDWHGQVFQMPLGEATA